MRKLKRIAAAVTAAVMVTVSAAGCSDTDYAMTMGNEKVNAGVYINFLLGEINNQMYTLYYSGQVTDMNKCPDTEIDGKSFTDYVKDTALKDMKEFAAINAKFDEFGLELSDEDKDEIASSVDSAWEQMGEYYEYQGISRESLKMTYEASYKRSAVFDHYYAEGGIEEVTNDDMQKYVNENYIRFKTIAVPKSVLEDETEAAAEDGESMALVNGYLLKAEEMSFEEFDQIIDEYDEYTEQQAAEENGEDTALTDEDAVTDIDSSSAADDTAEDTAPDTKETADTSTDTDETADSAEDDSAEDSVDDTTAEDESMAEEDTVTDDSAAEDSAADETAEGEEDTEEEEDPYINETIVNFTTASDTESDSYNEEYVKVLEAMKNSEYGKAAIYEDDNNIYLYMTADVSERTDYVEDNADTLRQTMKGDDFQKLIDSWVEALDIKVNDKAIKRYTVNEIFERQEEYYSENQGQ